MARISLAMSLTRKMGSAVVRTRMATLAKPCDGVGNPDLGISGFLHALVSDVRSYANHFEPTVLDRFGDSFQFVDENALTNGIFVAEIAALERLIDNGELACVSDFRGCEETTVKKPHS